MQLIRQFPLRRISSPSTHLLAKKIVLRLSTQPARRGTREYLDVLIDLIADYERRSQQTLDASALTPADLIRHRLSERNLSVSALARLIGIPQSNLSEMLSSRRDWSQSAIRGITHHLNIRTDRFFT